jgi:hypothetical protein
MVVDAGFDNTGKDSSGRDATGQDKAGSGGNDPNDGATKGLPDPRKLAQDWITLWQSELSAMAADPELRESWQTVMALWAGTMAAVMRAQPREKAAGRHDRTGGQAGAADAPRSAPAPAASDARDAEIERLARNVAVLERRLAELERGGNPAVHPKRRSERKPRK